MISEMLPAAGPPHGDDGEAGPSAGEALQISAGLHLVCGGAAWTHQVRTLSQGRNKPAARLTISNASPLSSLP